MNQPCAIYTSKEAASGIVSDAAITTISGFSALFATVGISRQTILRTDKDISIRLNSVSNDPISIMANEKFECDWMGISQIYLTAAASTNIKAITAR